MDKIIEAEVRRKKKLVFLRIGLISLGLFAGALVLLRKSFRSSIHKSEFTTAVVERGLVENTINATGEITPEFEEIISSPIHAAIRQVLMDAGTHVEAGQSILTLDKSASQTEYEKMKFQLESKHNDIKKLRLELAKSFYDLQSNNAIKQLKINSLKADVENARRLYKAGGGTREAVEQTELNLKVANLEKQQLENEIKNRQQTMQVQMREYQIAAAIQENALHEVERKLQQANIVASRAGVVTYVNKNIGAAVQEGESLARIADLGSFKITGSISDAYLDQLRAGMPTIIRINETALRGTVTNVYPSVQNGIVTFDVRLDDKNNKLLRPNMKVDLFLVTAAQHNVLRVANGAAFKGTPTQDVFVVHRGKAERRTVHTGLTNFDYVELKAGVQAGDQIITSDMSAYTNVEELTIKE